MLINEKILVVEDESDIRELIHFHLFKNKYKVIEASDGQQAIDIANEEMPSLIILDIMIPQLDGLKVCQSLKESEKTKDIKIIFLSAKGEENDIVRGLELGAEDYITKPFSPKVLIARVKAVLRRDHQETQESIDCHGIVINDVKKKVQSDQKELSLTASEYELCKLLVSSPGHVHTRSQIVNHIKGSNHAITDRSVDTLMVALRKKLGQKGKLIETVWGVGYKFKENEA